MALEGLGKLLVYIGVATVLIGGLFMLMAKVPWFGKLPGDIVFRREGLTIVFPLTTMIVVSIFLTLLINLFLHK